jgi:hypothetical protein
VGKQRVPLEDEPYGPLLDRKRTDLLPADQNTSLVRLIESGDEPEQSGFAASALAQENEPLPFFNLQRAILQDVPGTKRFGDAFQSNHKNTLGLSRLLGPEHVDGTALGSKSMMFKKLFQ